jgi:glycosyltransferase involved in cell wall biosynthesis
LLLKQVPETRLYVVGSSPTPEIQALAEQPAVTVTGFVEDIRDYYRLAQVVVVPLRTGVGIRGKILEGWSAGRAMVATSLACQGIDAIHGQNIMIADEPELFARWTVALLKHPDFCHDLGEKGRQLVEEKYDWDILGEQMIDLYEEVAGVPRISAR